jgi:hypothetical protein
LDGGGHHGKIRILTLVIVLKVPSGQIGFT